MVSASRNDTPDRQDTGTVTGENDLVKIILRKLLPGDWDGNVTLDDTGTGSKIKVWTTSTKGTSPTPGIAGCPGGFFSLAYASAR